MEEKNVDYLKEVSQNIEMAKILSSAPEKNREEIFNLLQKKKSICEKNGLLAEHKISRINKKIEKLLK
jgi:hypothetical protein